MNTTLTPQKTAPHVLGVTRSLTGREWKWREADERHTLMLAQRHGLSDIVARTLAAKGISADDAGDFLTPTLRALMPDPSTFQDMDKAAERLADAIIAKETIGIIGDYDVDGATSTALLLRFLRHLGAPCHSYIPDRIAEGYGPSIKAVDRLQQQGATLIITVDAGIVAFAPIAHAKAHGLDVLVVDHHIGEARLPEAYAVVNPNRFDEIGENPYGHLAAAGVTFLLVAATSRTLRAHNHYNSALPEPDLRHWLDIVALGTVCDVVSLTTLNRAFVSQGLKIMAGRGNVGIAALMDIGRVDEAPSAYHAGFVIGPRINAGGRVGESGLGAQILTTDDPAEAAHIAKQLDQYNAERKAIEQHVLEEATTQLDAQSSTSNMPVLFAVGEGWHPGVIGIVAGRLKERYYRPVAVIGIDEHGIGKASARSIPRVDFGSAVHAAKASGLLVAGGGHAMAAGFTVERAQIDALHAFLCERMGAAVDAQGATPPLTMDAAVAPGGATPELLLQLEKLAPFGMGNAEPRFVLPNVRIVQADIVKDVHIRLLLTEGELGGRVGKTRLKAMAFRALDDSVPGKISLGQQILAHQGKVVHLAGKLKLNRWQGRESVDVHVEDVAAVE